MERQKVRISPCMDLVFKAIMGDPAHSAVLLDFLNAVLTPLKIVDVEILNPTPFSRLLQERDMMVDVLAKDSSGRRFQIEMQGWNHTALNRRMLWNWAKLYQGQIQKGEEYPELRPVIAIWLVDDSIWAGEAWIHRFQVMDRNSAQLLCEDLDMHVFELEKARKLHLADSRDQGPVAGWIRFFTEAGNWKELPKELQRPAMEIAMSTVEKFREDAAATYAYEARQEWLRIQLTQDKELERVRAAEAKALQQLAAAQARVEEIQARADEQQARVQEIQAQADEQQARVEEIQARADEQQARADRAEAQLRELMARMKLPEN